MNVPVNLSELYVETHDIIMSKYKHNNGNIKNHNSQLRYLEFLTFVNNSCYWSRHNKEYDIDKCKNKNSTTYKKDCLSGKYLNELHLFYVKCIFIICFIKSYWIFG